MDAKSCTAKSTTTCSTSTSSSLSDVAMDALANRIRNVTGKTVNDEIWLENFLLEQERRRTSFQNKKSVELQKRLRKCKNNLNDHTDSIEKHYRMRRHVQRKDSKVSKNLKNLINRRQRYMEEVEKKYEVPQLNFVPCINEDGPIVEYKDGWIDLPQNNEPERQDSKSFLLKIKEQQSFVRKQSSDRSMEQGPLSSISESVAQMSISDAPKKQVSSESKNKKRVTSECKSTTKKEFESGSNPLDPDSKYMLLDKNKAAKSFVSRKTLVENQQLDNGAFSFSFW